MKQIQIVNTKTNEAPTFDNQADADAYISKHAVGNFVATKTYQAKVFGVKRITYTIAVSNDRIARHSFRIAVLNEEPNIFAHYHAKVVEMKATKKALITYADNAGIGEGLTMADKKMVLQNKIALALTVLQTDAILEQVLPKVTHDNLGDTIASLRNPAGWEVTA